MTEQPVPAQDDTLRAVRVLHQLDMLDPAEERRFADALEPPLPADLRDRIASWKARNP